MLSLNKLRINLTLMNTGVLIGLLLFISIFLYLVLSLDLETNVNNNLEIYCSQLANNIEYLEREARGEAVTQEEKNGYSEYSRSLSQNNIAFIIFNQNFKVMDRSTSLPIEENLCIDITKLYFNDNRNKYFTSNYKKENKEYKICTYMVVNKHGELKIVQAMKNMEPERNLLENALRMITIAVMVGASFSFLGGYFLSGRSLIPIKKSVKRQQEFLADASHELRTPIAVIQTNLEVMKDSGNETVDSQMDWLNNAYNEAKRMKDIVQDLMFLARADSGETISKQERVDLTFLIKSVSERMIPLARKKGIHLRNHLEDDLLIVGDEKQMLQLLIILLDNAIKYSDENTKITMTAKRNAQKIVIEVIDQGIGIPKEELAHVFERFYRIDKVRSRSEGGSGLGLSIAKWIVDQHDAEIILESEDMLGTKITVVFNEEGGLK